MLNNKPNGVGNYRQGLFVPKNKDKVYKLNSEGGLYYRSSWELSTMKYMDMCKEVRLWGVECIEIPYQLKKPNKLGIMSVTNHRYYPDFYYELEMDDGTIKKILLEVKPKKQTQKPVLKTQKRLTEKQLKNFKYDINEYNRNMSKWEATIEYCKHKDLEFKILTEENIKVMIMKYITNF
jgi:hypothetical protein